MRIEVDMADYPTYFAKGSDKVCFVGEKYPDRILKVSPLENCRPMRIEVSYLERLERLGRTADFMPKYYGWFKNDKYIGYVHQLVKSDSIIPLQKYIDLHADDLNLIEEKLAELKEKILSSKILVLNIHAQNILVDVSNMHLWLIDGYGTPEAIPLPYWFDVCRRRKEESHWAKFERRYGRLKAAAQLRLRERKAD